MMLSESLHTPIGISPRDLSAVVVRDASRFHLLTKLSVLFYLIRDAVRISLVKKLTTTLLSN